jgi:hypothetical protein
MNIRKNTITIFTVNMGTSEKPWNMFCGYDREKNRAIFFTELLMRGLPNYFSQEPVIITIIRDGKTFSQATPSLEGPRLEEYRLTGFQELPGMKYNTDILSVTHLKEGDVVTITKSDWLENDNPLNIVATKRTSLVNFHRTLTEVSLQLFTYINQIFSGQMNEDTTVVFETPPGPLFEKYF